MIDPSSGEIDEPSRVRQNAREYAEAADPCRAAKESRRHIIIANGHGGRNGFTDYHKHKEC
ncbi:MAG: hypothetical protein [Microvirus sp.]|nr:MAG: hypothetical protein [Microvirus sp.]